MTDSGTTANDAFAKAMADEACREFEKKMQARTSSGWEVLGDLVCLAIVVAGLSGGILFLSHVVLGWPT